MSHSQQHDGRQLMRHQNNLTLPKELRTLYSQVVVRVSEIVRVLVIVGGHHEPSREGPALAAARPAAEHTADDAAGGRMREAVGQYRGNGRKGNEDEDEEKRDFAAAAVLALFLSAGEHAGRVAHLQGRKNLGQGVEGVEGGLLSGRGGNSGARAGVAAGADVVVVLIEVGLHVVDVLGRLVVEVHGGDDDRGPDGAGQSANAGGLELGVVGVKAVRKHDFLDEDVAERAQVHQRSAELAHVGGALGRERRGELAAAVARQVLLVALKALGDGDKLELVRLGLAVAQDVLGADLAQRRRRQVAVERVCSAGGGGEQARVTQRRLERVHGVLEVDKAGGLGEGVAAGGNLRVVDIERVAVVVVGDEWVRHRLGEERVHVLRQGGAETLLRREGVGVVADVVLRCGGGSGGD